MRVLELLVMLIVFTPAGMAGVLSAYLARTSDSFWRIPAWVPVLPVAIDGAMIDVGTAVEWAA